MPLRRIAIAVAILAGLTAYVGQLPGRQKTSDAANCQWHGALDSLRPDPSSTRPSLELWPLEARPPCQPQIVVEMRPAVASEVSIVLAIVAVCAVLVALVPRRQLAGAWIVVSLVGTLIAFVLTRSVDVRWQEMVELWPRYATWAGAGLVAAIMCTVLVWLFGTESAPIAGTISSR